jgi:hypothetical protein
VPLIIAALFSVAMIVGELVLVEVTAGITEVVVTRSPSRGAASLAVSCTCPKLD